MPADAERPLRLAVGRPGRGYAELPNALLPRARRSPSLIP
jgi:hypothetical protein